MPRTIKGEGKRVPLNMRTTAETRRRIEEAAKASGRSLAQEVEYRLERSFRDDDVAAFLIRAQRPTQMDGQMFNVYDPNWRGF